MSHQRKIHMKNVVIERVGIEEEKKIMIVKVIVMRGEEVENIKGEDEDPVLGIGRGGVQVGIIVVIEILVEGTTSQEVIENCLQDGVVVVVMEGVPKGQLRETIQEVEVGVVVIIEVIAAKEVGVTAPIVRIEVPEDLAHLLHIENNISILKLISLQHEILN